MRRFDEEKLNDVYRYICDCHINERRSPTYREIGAACGIGSTSWVSRLIEALEEREMIEVSYEGGRRILTIPDNLHIGQTRHTSIVGSCPCGTPLLAVENITATVALPVEIFGTEEHFILQAKGQSMIKRGIFDGDLMVVKVQNTANVGEVVIARLNQEEVTAKVLACDHGKYYLEPANDEVDEHGKPVYGDIYPDGEWDILGVVDHVIHAP
jgi:repressor LexA